MILATLKGRLQTKLLTYIILALVTAVFAAMYGTTYWAVFGVAVVVGLVLEALWGMVVQYQSGWMTFLFGAIEFIVIVLYTIFLSMPMAFMDALKYYLTAWILIQLFLIYIFPVFRLSWGDDGLELW
jgi:hypothetical protein